MKHFPHLDFNEINLRKYHSLHSRFTCLKVILRRKERGAQGRHVMGEEVPARETHENRFPALYPITWQALPDLSEILTEND